jgi:hypothetical protein
MMLTIKEAAAKLRVSQQWLKYWLVENPVDAAGVPFYVRMGSRMKFEQRDIERILAHMRQLESARLGLSGKSKARLAGLLSQIGGGVTYEERLRIREEDKRKKEAEKRARQPRGRPPRFKPIDG